MGFNEKMTSIANKIRSLTGSTETLSFSEMEADLAIANTEKENMITALEEMGVVVEDGASLGDIADLITTVETGTDTSDATATSNDILSGKTAYVGGEKITGNIAFQPAKTITPSTASQIAVSSGYYTGGDITIAGDANLVAGNIKSGVSIFGVAGSYEGSGSSGNADIEDSLITRNITTYTNSRVSTIGNYAFYSCSSLTSVNFPACTTIGSYAFYSCTSLTSVNFPACTTIGSYAFCKCSRLTSVNFPACTTIKGSAFINCSRLTSVSFPACTTIGNSAFFYCYSLTSVNFPACTTIGSYAFCKCSRLTSVNFPACTTIKGSAFISCSNLKSLYLMGSSLCRLSNSNAFTSTPIGGYSGSAGTYGSIYVPASLLTSYKTATNWTYFSSRFVGI